MTRTFYLVRETDVTGVSGTGVVAEGIQFSDGTCAMRWRTETASTATYASIDDVQRIHGHGGATRVLFVEKTATAEEAAAVAEPKHQAAENTPESNLVAHARRELSLLGDQDDPLNAAMSAHLLRMVGIFADEGHSGGSAAYAIAALGKLLRFEPLTPLTGAPDEWIEAGPGMFQNRRCSHVFWETGGQPYDIEGRVFIGADGTGYTNADSRVEVTFPYVPHTERIQAEDLVDAEIYDDEDDQEAAS